MTKQDWFLVFSRVIFMWLAMGVMIPLHESPVIIAPVMAIAFATGWWLSKVLMLWFWLGKCALSLSDDAAVNLSDADAGSQEIQVTTVISRKYPPRQMYASAIAHRGDPITMYRGWRILKFMSSDRPESFRTTGWSCWRFRP